MAGAELCDSHGNWGCVGYGRTDCRKMMNKGVMACVLLVGASASIPGIIGSLGSTKQGVSPSTARSACYILKK